MSKKCGKIPFEKIISKLEKNRENIGILLILNLAKFYKAKFTDYGEDYFELIYGDPRIYMSHDKETLEHYINILENNHMEIITLKEIIQLFIEGKPYEEIFDKFEGLFKNASITSNEMENEYIDSKQSNDSMDEENSNSVLYYDYMKDKQFAFFDSLLFFSVIF